MASEATAFWHAAPRRGELRTEPLGPPGPGEVQVRARVSAISRGTEALVFAGKVPPSQYDTMRCPFQAGDFPAPVKYGYASVGTIEAVGDNVDPARIGQRVFCLYPHQDRYVVPAAAARPLPDALDARRAALAANMETAVNALWDGAPRLGDRVAVVGAGTVGCLATALLARMPATDVTLVDVADCAAVAAALGARFAAPDDAPGDCDIVVHASGTAAGLATALGLAGFEATVLELSWYGEPVSAPLGEDFHVKRLTLRSSQVSSVATARRARRSYADRLDLALRLLEDPVFDALLTGESAFADLPETMARLADVRLCHLVRYD